MPLLLDEDDVVCTICGTVTTFTLTYLLGSLEYLYSPFVLYLSAFLSIPSTFSSFISCSLLIILEPQYSHLSLPCSLAPPQFGHASWYSIIVRVIFLSLVKLNPVAALYTKYIISNGIKTGSAIIKMITMKAIIINIVYNRFSNRLCSEYSYEPPSESLCCDKSNANASSGY